MVSHLLVAEAFDSLATWTRFNQKGVAHMTKFSANTWKLSTIGLTILLALIVLPAAFVSPVNAVSDNTNLVQQILLIVQNIQTGLTGASGSLSTLGTDVGAIKAKTDNLPQDTEAKLTTLQQSVDDVKESAGPLNKMFMKTLSFGISEQGGVTCSSTGPYLLHVHAQGVNSNVFAELNQTPIYGDLLDSFRTTSFVVGGSASDLIRISGSAGSATNPNAFIDILITMQTTASAVVGCN
jgi:uncharacterized protein YoxC